MTTAPARIAVAAAQYPLDATDSMAAWTAKVSRWVADGAANDAQLLVFPEYGALEVAATRGPSATADLAATLAAVADAEVATAQVWTTLAAHHHVHILAPSGPARRVQGYVNSCRLFAPGGGIGVQDKLILTPFEREWGMAPGHGQRLFDTELGRIGIAICYDSEFPLLVRALVEAGADIVLVPSCTEHESGFHRVRTSALARALENQIATVMSPTIGAAAWSPAIDRNFGAAGIFAPPDIGISMNGVLAEGTANVPCWVVAEVDLALLSHLRESGEMRNRQHWVQQPDAAPLGADVEISRLS